MIAGFFAAFSFGFMGSLHCVGMCGGLVGAFSMGRARMRWLGLGAYQVGRILTYAILGATVAVFGAGLEEIGGSGFQKIMAVFAGIIMAGFGLNMLGILPDPLGRMTGRISGILEIGKRLQSVYENPSLAGWFSAGLVNGLLPCGLVYAALAMSLSSGQVLPGAFLMTFFGIGTIPAMMFAPAVMRLMKPGIRGRVLRTAGVVMIVYGIFTGLRGTHLMPTMHKHGMIHNSAGFADVAHNENPFRSKVDPGKEMCNVNEYLLKDSGGR